MQLLAAFDGLCKVDPYYEVCSYHRGNGYKNGEDGLCRLFVISLHARARKWLDKAWDEANTIWDLFRAFIRFFKPGPIDEAEFEDVTWSLEHQPCEEEELVLNNMQCEQKELSNVQSATDEHDVCAADGVMVQGIFQSGKIVLLLDDASLPPTIEIVDEEQSIVFTQVILTASASAAGDGTEKITIMKEEAEAFVDADAEVVHEPMEIVSVKNSGEKVSHMAETVYPIEEQSEYVDGFSYKILLSIWSCQQVGLEPSWRINQEWC